MRFSETIKHADKTLVVSRRHEQWLARNDHPAYSEKALRFAAEQLAKPPRDRTGTVSASSLGECLRYQQFVYLGMPKLPPTAQNASRMHNGTFMHLRWQMEGLTEGWLREAEVPVISEEYGVQGTADGICHDGSLLELKSINSDGFRRVMTFGPLKNHLTQMATYLLCTGIEQGVFIYENKDNQEYTEIVFRQDPWFATQVKDQATTLRVGIEAHTLAEPLEKCLDMQGFRYTSCPFRDRCLSVYTWEDAGGDPRPA